MLEIRFQFDDTPFSTVGGNTTMQSSLSIGFDIPRFCYHEKLSIAGNCRMCLLEISYPRSLKPMASCALPIISGMSVYSNTIMVKKSREGVLELLLLNHPLDCPVCDQGGECDLQDETIRYGTDRGRFYESKRAVEDKECGPTIKTSMNRCIHCTKCIRFCNEICGEPVLGTLGRGSSMEVGTYVDEMIESELSGNLVDICPVGALTSKPYAFKARPWELRSFETVDVIDSLGSKIRVDIRGTDIMRVLPSQSEELNEDWITDRTRFSYDGLKIQRLYVPMVKMNSNLVPVSWETVFKISSFFLNKFISKNLNDENYLNLFLNRRTSVSGIFGDLADSETLVVLSEFFRELGSTFLIFQDQFISNTDFRSAYLLNIPLEVIEKTDLCIIVGLNLRLELPLLNLRIRKAFLQNNALVISFGFVTNLTYRYFQQGNNLDSFFKFLNGKSYASKSLLDASFPIIFVGSYFLKIMSSILSFEIFKGLIKYSNIFTETGWLGLNLIDSRISLNSAHDLGLCYTTFQEDTLLDSSFLYLYGIERSTLKTLPVNSFFFRIFQGHSGDMNASMADVVLPGCTFIEKEAMYTTLEGRIQKTKFLLAGLSLSRIDWKIITGFRIYFFAHYLNNNEISSKGYRQFSKINEIRSRLIEYSPSFRIPELVTVHFSHKFFSTFSSFNHGSVFRILFYIYNFLFINNSKNFFLNNAITRNSKIMSICAGRYAIRQSNFWK